jgi:hypothetical protein
MKAIGARMSVFMAGSTMVSGTLGMAYEGGRWDHGQFFYNRSVNNVNVTIVRNVYNTTVINNTTVNRVSYNGGNGGINARPSQGPNKRLRHTKGMFRRLPLKLSMYRWREPIRGKEPQ